ncbi:MAG: hypothetical protein JO352_19890 [Chloroflexi bacterium]|nr:hypothetical protein [Chloroflexota bacterium]
MLEFEDAFTNLDDRHGKLVCETACRLNELAGQTLSLVQQVNGDLHAEAEGVTLANQERPLRQLTRARKRQRFSDRAAPTL